MALVVQLEKKKLFMQFNKKKNCLFQLSLHCFTLFIPLPSPFFLDTYSSKIEEAFELVDMAWKSDIRKDLEPCESGTNGCIQPNNQLEPNT